MNQGNAVLNYKKKIDAAKQFILKHDHFLVVSHVQPDGDAASSTSAVGYILQSLNKSFVMVNEDPIPRKFDYLWGYNQILSYLKLPEGASFSYIISVDCADYLRIGQVHQFFSGDAVILNIDHHPTNDEFGAVNVVHSEAAATAEILYDLANSLLIKWHPDLANSIYTGLLTDTGGFRYSNTTPKVMQIASELLEYGVNGHHLANELLEKSTHAHILLLKRALATLTFAENNQLAWLSVTIEDLKESNASNDDFEGLVNYPRNIEGVEVGLLFKQIDPDTVKVSFRSAGKVDVAQIAKHFGGGGHVRAAGCTMKGTMDRIISDVTEKVGHFLR